MPNGRVKAILEEVGSTVFPGVYDALSAKMAESVGFRLAFVSGYAVSAASLGEPDMGLLTQTEIVDRARYICKSVSIPIIVDADTGYGGLLNLRHAVKSYEKAGVAAIQIEDQVFPKRCGHAKGIEVCSVDEMKNRIGVASESRNSDDLLIIARTDSRLEFGLNEAIKRAKAYSKAGADLIFVESLQSLDEIEKLKKSIDKPLVYKMVPDGDLSNIHPTILKKLGYSIIIYPTLGFLSAADAIERAFVEFKTNGLVKTQKLQKFDEFSKMIGFDEIYSFEERWKN